MNGRLESELNKQKVIKAKLAKLPPIFTEFYSYMEEDDRSYNTIEHYIDYNVEFMEYITKGKKDDEYYKSLRELLSYDWGNLESTKANNKIWYHVSRQDEFVKIKNSVLGMLFDDLDSGMDFDHAAARFNDAVDPLHYKRPDALPSITQVKEAQKVIDELGLEPSFHRRHALVNEIPLFWKPQEVVTEEKKEEPSGGLFSNIPTKDYHREVKTTISKPTQDVPIDITWAKFHRDILPNVAIVGNPYSHPVRQSKAPSVINTVLILFFIT